MKWAHNRRGYLFLFANICTEHELTNFYELCVFERDWNKNESIMKCEMNEMDKSSQTHTSKSENEQDRCVWKIVLPMPICCWSVYACSAYEENLFNINPNTASPQVCTPRTAHQYSCGTPAVLPMHTHIRFIYTDFHRRQTHTNQSTDEQNEHTSPIAVSFIYRTYWRIRVLVQHSVEAFLYWQPCNFEYEKANYLKNCDWTMLVHMIYFKNNTKRKIHHSWFLFLSVYINIIQLWIQCAWIQEWNHNDNIKCISNIKYVQFNAEPRNCFDFSLLFSSLSK